MIPDNLFLATTDAGANWELVSTGYDSKTGSYWFVTTDHVHGSDLHTVSRGARGDAELIARLLNWYYHDQDSAEQAMLGG